MKDVIKDVMVKISLALLITSASFVTFAKEEVKKKIKKSATREAKVAETKPCDTKEDILKKLEEKQKVDPAAPKAFSLQGGDTGCKVK